eukprot:m.38797 g.38797  ORF g.38797 m.38797 type:complete len:291 (+) comp12619_c0_seq1:63-935(+)
MASKSSSLALEHTVPEVFPLDDGQQATVHVITAFDNKPAAVFWTYESSQAIVDAQIVEAENHDHVIFPFYALKTKGNRLAFADKRSKDWKAEMDLQLRVRFEGMENWLTGQLIFNMRNQRMSCADRLSKRKKTLTNALDKVNWNPHRLPKKSQDSMRTFYDIYRQTRMTSKLKFKAAAQAVVNETVAMLRAKLPSDELPHELREPVAESVSPVQQPSVLSPDPCNSPLAAALISDPPSFKSNSQDYTPDLTMSQVDGLDDACLDFLNGSFLLSELENTDFWLTPTGILPA